MTDKKVILGDFVRERGLSYDDLIRLAIDGNIDIRKPQDRESLEALLHELDPLVRATSSEETSTNLVLETQIVRIRIPGRNIYYVTIMKGGKVIMTKDVNGDLDLSHPKQGLDEITDMLAYSTMLDTARRIESTKKTKTGKGGKNPTFKPTRDKPGYVRDPALDIYLLENAQALAFNALSSPEKLRKGQVLTTRDELEEVIDDPKFLATATELGFAIEAESITSYIARHRGEISRKTKRVINKIIEKQEVRKIAAEVLLEYIDRADPKKQKLRVLCEKSDSILELYKKLNDKKLAERLDDKGEHFVICFRQMSLDVIYGIKKIGIEISRDEFNKYITSTAKWVAYAKAGDYIQGDDYIQREILPKLRAIEDRASRDKIFEVVSDLGRLVIDPSHSYDRIFFRFLIAGLWMEGVMEKETEKGVESRTLGGAMNEYTDGVGNLIERYGLYDKLLRKTFKKHLEQGAFNEKNLALSTQAECSIFGRSLYDLLDDKDKIKFTSIRDGTRPLTEGGTYLVRLLRSYIGINRKYFIDEIQKRTGDTKDATQ